MFIRLGSKIKTYSGVVGEQCGYVQQPCGSKERSVDRPGPSERTNDNQFTNVNVKASSSKAPEHQIVRDPHHSSAQAKASGNTTMKGSQTSRTRHSTTDLQQPEITQVKTPFKFILIMPPMKSKDARPISRNTDKADLDLNLLARRPLSPISNSTSSTKDKSRMRINKRDSFLKQKHQISETSGSESMEFESID